MNRSRFLILYIFLTAIVMLSAKERFELSPVQNAPVIDGKIGSGEWEDAIWIDNFYQIAPGDNETPTEKTEVAISYDQKNLYLLAKVFYADKSKERAFHGSRDKIYSSDRIFFFFDTFGSNNQGYYVGANAFGEQADGLIRQDIDPSIDLYYKSVTSGTDFGWILEMEVPLKSLNYKSGENVNWGFFIKRHINEGNEQITSFPVDRSGGNFYDNYGILEFSYLPEKRNLKIIPALIGLQEYEKNNLSNTDNSDSKLEPELNMFFEPNSNITFTATINPDFNIVEADGVEIEINNRYPSWASEKRPFFIEERNPYQTDLNIFHTRNIVNPLWGAKLSANYDRTSFFALVSQDQDAAGERFYDEFYGVTDEAYFGFANIKRQLGDDDSFVRVGSAIRSFQNRENLVINSDCFMRYHQSLTQEMQFIYSKNEFEIEDKSGFAYHSDLDFNTENIYMEYEQTGVTENFRADLGFMHETDYQRSSGHIEYHKNAQQEQEFIHYMEIATSVTAKWDFAFDDVKEINIEPMLGFNTRENWNLWLGVEQVMNHEYEQDLWEWYQWTSAEYFPLKQVGATFLYVFGEGNYYSASEPNLESYRKYESTISLRPFSQLDIEVRHKYHSLENNYLVRTLEVNSKVQFHKNFWFRLIYQVRNIDNIYFDNYKDSARIYPLFTYKPNAKMSFYLGATGSNEDVYDDNETGSMDYVADEEFYSWFLKMSYTFDVL